MENCPYPHRTQKSHPSIHAVHLLPSVKEWCHIRFPYLPLQWKVCSCHLHLTLQLPIQHRQRKYKIPALPSQFLQNGLFHFPCPGMDIYLSIRSYLPLSQDIHPDGRTPQSHQNKPAFSCPVLIYSAYAVLPDHVSEFLPVH